MFGLKRFDPYELDECEHQWVVRGGFGSIYYYKCIHCGRTIRADVNGNVAYAVVKNGDRKRRLLR